MENLLDCGSCYRCIDGSIGWPEYVRVIAILQCKDVAWLIALPYARLMNDKKVKHKKSHANAPFKVCLSGLRAHIAANRLVSGPIQIPNLWTLSDDQLATRFGSKSSLIDGGINSHDRQTPAIKIAMLNIRDQRWNKIKGLVMGTQITDILENMLLAKFIRDQRLTKVKRSVYDAFHSYLAGGQNKNALLPAFDRCGAPGTIRKQKKKIGRKNALCRRDPSAPQGKLITFKDHENIAAGYGAFVCKDRTLQFAYDETMKTFYARSQTKEHGVTYVDLLDVNERPTIDQFAYWGRLLTGESTSRKQTNVIDYMKSERPLPGKATDGIPYFGHTAVCDATPIDVHCVSIVDRLERVGVASRILIDDMFVAHYRLGFDISFEPPSAKTALRAIAHATCNKVEFCSRYGIDIKPHEWYSCLPLNLLTDNGEFNCAEVNAAGEMLHFGLERTPTHRADLKPVESAHHSDHAKLDHRLPGTTHGRQRQRGAAHPALDAKLTLHEYIRLYIRRVLAHNNKHEVSELLTSEMIKDKVAPHRGEIVRWCIANGRIAHNPYDADAIKAMLYPELPAVLTEKGIFLIAKQGGTYDKVLHRARFFNDYLLTSGAMEAARRNGHIRTCVRGLTSDLSRVWLPTKDGLKELKNVSDDVLVVNTASLADLAFIEEKLLREKLERRQQADQNRVNESTTREDVVAAATAAQNEAEALLSKKQTKKEKLSHISENREEEIRRLQNDHTKNKPSTMPSLGTAPVPVPDLAEETSQAKTLRLYREKRQVKGTTRE
jgi:putative transposase